jgi:hypothetical protein
MKKLLEPKTDVCKREYPCTQCGGDATLAYSEGWDGKVKKGERLCTSCFCKRGGKRFF